ncbi:MAG: PorT family protein [Candidatus Azobacteroides sp.]|nr:PorT family protein [Candidatus Azobacteroides sp.]
MKKIIFIAFTLWIIESNSTNAQVVWGLRARVSRPMMNMNNSEGVSFDGRFGLEIGPILYCSLKNNFYINSGLMFSMNRFKCSYKYYYYNDYYRINDDEIDLHYLEIPLYIGYSIPIGTLHTYVQVGPYIGFKLLASKTWNDGGYNKKTFNDITNLLNAGLGTMYGININRFKIEVGYQYGLTRITKNDDEYNRVKLSSLFLGVNYVF